MKTYTFYYYDCSHDFYEDIITEFVYSASRFSVAFKAFYDYIVMCSFYYFNFSNVYLVSCNGSSQLRTLSKNYFYTLDRLRKLPND